MSNHQHSNQHQQHAKPQNERDQSEHKSGNFKNDPDKAREAGQKGGSHSQGRKEDRE